jgi:transcriptional regulator with XRE-family HTH domain
MKKLSILRNQKGLSQGELAEKMGMSQQTISKYERGLLEPALETLNFLADFFNVSVDYLLGRSDQPDTAVDNLYSQYSAPSPRYSLVSEDPASYDDELFQKRKILFEKTTKASEKEINKMLKVLELLEDESVN